VTWKIRDTIPTLQEGDVLTYAIEATDRYTGEGGAHRSRSQARRLYIVSVEEYRRHVLEKRRKLRAELEALHGQEKEAATEVDILIQDKDDEDAQPPRPDDEKPDNAAEKK